MEPIWRWPISHLQHPSATAGKLVMVGGAGDFDTKGAIRNPGDLAAQIEGALANVAAALAPEGCRLADVVRFKAFYTGECDDWEVIAALARAVPEDPMPAISTVPTPFQPFEGQLVQLQAIAQKGWRGFDDVRAAPRPVPAAKRGLFNGRTVTGGVRAGEFWAVSNRTAADENDAIAAPGDAVAQSHVVQQTHEETLAQLGCSLQDSVKMEGYYFGETTGEWAEIAKARCARIREPGPCGTVVPCHRLHPEGAATKIEHLGFRESWNGFDKYIPRADCWPKRVWDWPIPLPYRQGQKLRDTIWTGGQVPWEPGSNSGGWMYPGDLHAQTRFVLSYMADLLRGFDRGFADLKLLTCYFTSSGTVEETHTFLDTLAGTLGGALPPITLVPQPYMHDPGTTVEIWGIAQA